MRTLLFLIQITRRDDIPLIFLDRKMEEIFFPKKITHNIMGFYFNVFYKKPYNNIQKAI